ncbi:unnamed protein product [Didymodactylos carnosus]|uniref:Uncharacterized protein n=1 Tax=Didymodactylos carnosus TaxID=1234261 RepID=A0A815QNE5_9BILA|nr:unnamed protein product [Didymodactylos carnosus]CAF4333876.1 unnamed protein product [Didymodactylos carnosus]
MFAIYGILDEEPKRVSGVQPRDTSIDPKRYVSLALKKDQIYLYKTNLDANDIRKMLEIQLNADQSLLSKSELSGIIAAVWNCAFIGKSSSHRLGQIFYDCILWSSRMHEFHCSIISKYVEQIIQYDQKRISSEKINSYNYRRLIRCILSNSTKQFRNINGRSSVKINIFRFLFNTLLRIEAEYLIAYDIEMAFYAYQEYAQLKKMSLVDILKFQILLADSNSDTKKRILLGTLIKWIEDDT